MGSEVFQVDAAAHAAAKESGDYSLEGKEVEETTTESDDKTEESIISDVDPGDEEGEEEKVETKDEETEEEETEADEEKEEKDPEEDSDGTDFDTLHAGWTEEFLEKGNLSEDTKAAILENVFQADIPSEMKEQIVDAYEAGLVALTNATTAEAYDLTGGEESYKNMLVWANETLSDEEATAFDEAVLGTDKTTRHSAIKGLHAQMQQALGSEPNFEPNLAHSAGKASGEPIIGSRQELAKIQATVEYKKDPAVRQRVANQLRQSMATGKYIA
jgi:hypothetical protein